jgi:ornithine cyclodeaminase
VRRAGRVFVDTRAGSEGSGEIGIPLARGLINRNHIVADLFDLCSGRHSGREKDSEITMFKNGGGAHLDLFTIRLLAARIARK